MSRGIHGNIKEFLRRKREFRDSWECKGILRVSKKDHGNPQELMGIFDPQFYIQFV